MLDPVELDNALSSITRTESMWDMPPLPDTTKLDMASLLGTGARRFMFSVQQQVNKAMSQYDRPDPMSPIVPTGSGPSIGLESLGVVPSPGVTGLTMPIAAPTTSVMEQEDLNWLDTVSQGLTGVAGASLMPQHARYQNQFDITQSLPYVRDRDSVKVLKQQAIDMGLLPESTTIDGRWDPAMNVLLSDMANEDFNRSLHGERPGAVSVSKALGFLGEALSPEFAFMVGKEVVGNIAKGYFWNPGDIRDQHQANLKRYREVNEDPNASTWDQMRALGSVVFGVADDLVMPVVNWGLTLMGVGGLAIFGRALFGVSAAQKAAQGAKAYGAAAATARMAQVADTAGDVMKTGKSSGLILRGFDQAAALTEMEKWVRGGRVTAKLTDWMPGVDPAGKLEAWRGMRGVMLGRKATQQMIKFNQSQLLMSAAGNNPADYYIEEARGRYDDWLRQNIPAGIAVGVLSGLVMPRSIYHRPTLVSRGAEAAERTRRLAQSSHLADAATRHYMEVLVKGGEGQRAEALSAVIRQHGPVTGWAVAQHGTEILNNPRLRDEAVAKSQKMLWESMVMSGLEHRVDQVVHTVGDGATLDPDIRRSHSFKARNKMLTQITEWDAEDINQFEAKVQSLLDEAEYLGNSDEAASLRAELQMWADAPDEVRSREFGAWASQANNNRNALIQDLVMPVYRDPTILTNYLERNPTWLSEDTYDRYHSGWAELSAWVDDVADGTVLPKRGSRQAGVRAGAATRKPLDRVELQEGLTREGVEGRFPSLGEMLAPGGDDALRSQVGMDNPDLDAALDMLLRGEISTRSSLLNTPSMANVLYRDVDDPAMGKFALARMETLTGNEAHVFIDSMHSAVRNLETFDTLITSQSLGSLGSYVSKSKVNLSALDRKVFRRYVMNALTRAKALDPTMVSQLSTPQGVHDLQNLVGFLQAGNVDFNDLLTAHRQLNARVAKLTESDVWYSLLGVPDRMRTAKRASTVAHAQDMMKSARSYANTLAHDVHEAPAHVRRSLSHLGYKPVFGQDFHEAAAISNALALGDKLGGVGHWGEIGQTALSMFMPDKWAESNLLKNVANTVGRVSAWAMQPGDRRFVALYEKALKASLGRRLAQVDEADRVGLFGKDVFDHVDIDELYRAMWEANQKGRRSAQKAHDDLTGFTFSQKIGQAFTPQTLREAAPKRLVPNVVFRDIHMSDMPTSVQKAIRKAMRDALDPSRAFPDEAFQVRGPIQMGEDWLRAHGTMRGLAVGLPLLAASSMHRVQRQVVDNPSWFRALGSGAVATGAVGLSEVLGDGLTGDDALAALAMGGATALGSRATNRALMPFLGAYVGQQAMPDNQLLGTGLGGLLGAASSLPAVRKLEEKAWGAGRETSTLGRVAGAAAGAAAGSAIQPEGVGEDSEWAARGIGALLGQFAAPGIAAAAGPLARKISDNPLHQWFLEVGRFSSNTMTNKAFNLTMAMRFTLSPLFDIQRHLELASFSISKELEGATVPLKPMGRRAFVQKHGTTQWNEWAQRYGNAGRRAHGGVEQAYDAGEVAADLFRSQGILGFNPTDKGISMFKGLVDQGVAEDKAFRHVREILGYGVDGRRTGELTVNAIFFPFSFQSRYVGRWAKWLQNDAMRGMLIAEGMRTYEVLDERYDLDEYFEAHLPLVDQLNKINAFGFGISPGELGGIHRPWINFFVPIVTSAIAVGPNVVNFRNPYEGISALGEGVSKTVEENVVDGQALVKRIIPMWRDVAYLIDDVKDQGHVIFSPRHLTPEVEVGRAYQKWNAARRHHAAIASGNGYTDMAAFSRTARGAYYANELQRRRQELMEEFPAWQDSIEESVTRNAASRYTLSQQAANPVYLVDYDTRSFVTALEDLELRYAGLGYDFNDPSSLPEAVFEEVREKALELAGHGNGFDRVWDKHFRKVWGPITRPVYLTQPVTGQQVTGDQMLGEAPTEEMREPPDPDLARLAGAEA